MSFRRFKKNYKRSYFRGNSRKSAFGGTVKSVAEIEALSSKIKQQEKVEFEEFEKMFDADLRAMS